MFQIKNCQRQSFNTNIHSYPHVLEWIYNMSDALVYDLYTTGGVARWCGKRDFKKNEKSVLAEIKPSRARRLIINRKHVRSREILFVLMLSSCTRAVVRFAIDTSHY